MRRPVHTGSKAKVVTVEEAAQQLSISRSVMFGLIMSGEIRSLKIGRRRLVPVAAIDEFVESRSRGTS